MHSPVPSDDPKAVWNLPNQLTVSRLVLSIILFVLLSYDLFLVGGVLFVIAASTDWLDGHFARKYGLVTQLGRILDPFVDKIIVCGTFVFLSSEPNSGIAAWMTVVIVGRELLVTALRSYLEQQGADFSAQMSGKLKMVLQCVAATTSLFYLAALGRTDDPQTPILHLLHNVVSVAVWLAVFLTIYSGWMYIRRAWGLIVRH